MSEVIKVGIADYKLCYTPDSITTIGLGSCVGIVLYSKTADICGLLHILLPSSTEIKNNSNRSKFADTGLIDMITELEKKGLKKSQMVAKIAGGATMFQFTSGINAVSIGERNVSAVKSILANQGIPIISEDTGEDYGRTIVFNTQSKQLLVKAAGKGDRVI